MDSCAERLAGYITAECGEEFASLGGNAAHQALMDAGVPVGLGTDGPASNDRLDLLGEARTAALLARATRHDVSAMTAADALLLATRHSAEALGRDDIGALEAGRWADVVTVGIDTPAFATGLEVPDDELIGNLVWAAGAGSVVDVRVAGELVVAGGETLRSDRRQAQAEVRGIAARLRQPVDASLG